MDLEELKQTWKQSENINQIQNNNIMEMIRNKSYGPLAMLKREYKKQVRVMIIIPIIIFFTNVDNVQAILTNVLFWSYIIFCIGLVVFAYLNYRLVDKMEGMDRLVKSNLEQQISILQTRLKWLRVGLRIALIFFIALTEILPYFQHARMLDKWHAVSPYIRYAAYATLLLLQYFLSRAVLQRKFGQHLSYLKELLDKMQ
jgi:hypothetical protein